MSPEGVLSIFQNALEVILLITLVILIPALLVGLMVSMFQAATQINEMTLSFIPKLLITLLTLVVAGPWLLQVLIDYTRNLVMEIPYLVG